jgi:hypothetical protein
MIERSDHQTSTVDEAYDWVAALFNAKRNAPSMVPGQTVNFSRMQGDVEENVPEELNELDAQAQYAEIAKKRQEAFRKEAARRQIADLEAKIKQLEAEEAARANGYARLGCLGWVPAQQSETQHRGAGKPHRQHRGAPPGAGSGTDLGLGPGSQPTHDFHVL